MILKMIASITNDDSRYSKFVKNIFLRKYTYFYGKIFLRKYLTTLESLMGKAAASAHIDT